VVVTEYGRGKMRPDLEIRFGTPSIQDILIVLVLMYVWVAFYKRHVMNLCLMAFG
jgi:hypothetical protein